MSGLPWPREPRDPSPLRPYSLTGGRTHPSRPDLSVTSLVMAVPAAGEPSVEPEQHRILAACLRPAPVAEVAARADLPLGVARILLSDLLDRGLLMRCGSEQGRERPSMDTLRSVLERIREL